MFPKVWEKTKSSILIGLSINPFCGTPIFGNTHLLGFKVVVRKLKIGTTML